MTNIRPGTEPRNRKGFESYLIVLPWIFALHASAAVPPPVAVPISSHSVPCVIYSTMLGARHEGLLNALAPCSKQVAPAKMSRDDWGECKEPPGGRSPCLLHPSVERYSACAFPSELAQ